MQHRRRPFQLTNKIAHVALLAAAAGSSLLASSEDAHAQAAAFPFPSGNTTALRTGALTTHELRAQYEFWKEEFLEDCNDGSARVAYPENEGNDTRSEGVGYGMVIAAYMGDKDTFDKLHAYWRRFPTSGGLMNWRTFGCGGGSEAGSASDADVDAALGLIIADKQWGGYAGFANTVISAIRTAELLTCGGLRLLDPGSDGAFGSCGCLNPSYFAPGYYAAYAATDTQNAGLWNQTVGDAYANFTAIQNTQSGLVPAWSSATAVQTQNCNFQVAGGGNENEYQSDAARVPWRVATDLAWTGSAPARTFLTRMLGWLNTGNRITHIVDRFQLGGAALPPFVPGGANNNAPLNNMTLDATGRRSTITMGAFATAGIAGTQEQLDRLVGAWQSLYRAGDNLGAGGAFEPHAFNNSLALLYGMLATGTMWNPLGANPTRIEEPVLVDQPNAVIQNGDFDEGLQGWNMELLGGVDAEGFAMHQDGEVHIVIQKVSGVPQTAYMLRLRQPIAIQANQNYRVSITARAAAPRLMRMFVGQRDEPYTTYFSLDDDPQAEGDGINLTTEMQTFSAVVAGAATTGVVQLSLDFGDDAAEVVIDDVLVAPTSDPVTAPGTTIVTPPVTPDPNNPTPTNPDGTPTTPGAGGTGSNLGPINPNGDPGSPGLQPVGAVPGATNGLPPVSTGRPNGNGTCTVVDDPACNGFECSVPLGLCYDANGYVWDASQNGGQGGWSLPPYNVLGCGPLYVFLPTASTCYDPETGYYFNPETQQWVYWGDNYTAGQDDPADDGCAMSGAPATGSSAGWLLVGLLGAAGGLAYRRRRA